MDSIVLVLSSLGIAQAIFLCLYLFTLKKGNRQANIFLALFLLGLTMRIGKSILNVHIGLEAWERNLGLSGILLAGPFLWLYGRALLAKGKEISSNNYGHVLPFILFVTGCGFIPNGGRGWGYTVYLLLFAHLLIYIALATSLLWTNRSVASKALWKWYRNLVIGAFLIWVFYMGNLMGFIPHYIGGAIFFSLLVYSLSFLLLKRSSFTLEKYSGSSIDASSSKKHMHKIRTFFETETSYLNSNLNMAQVAEKIGIPARDVSQVINENEQQNFSEFVNHYRIQKAKDLLIDPSYAQEKIATVAYDSGFGNVTSFNLAFKAATQLTPSQYRNKFRLA